MSLDPSTFEYLKPTDAQIETMALRMHRTNSMWCNVAITRQPDGAARQ